MKKIGIMTMHRIINYGSFLQAYCLMKTIESFGYKTEFVDYEYEGKIIPDAPSISLFDKLLRRINVVAAYKRRSKRLEFENKYNNEFLKLLNVHSNYNIRPKIDQLVIGSDEVFNCLQDYPVGFSTELFGNHYENIDVISYAACFGHTTYNQLKDYNKTNEIGNYLKHFKSISVRDKNSFEIIKKLTGRIPEINVDPVIIYDFEDELKRQVKHNNYIIVYAYPGRFTREEKKYIKNFAKKHHKKIISLGFYQSFANYNLILDPFEMLSYIKNADYVITDTFHGTIFSIKMNCNFCTIIRESNKNKLFDLIEKFSLEDRCVKTLSDIEHIYDKKINFSIVNKVIEEEKNKSIEYLKNNLI